MSYRPGATQSELPPIFLTTWHQYRANSRGTTPASAAWSTTNRIIYTPVALSRGAMVYRYFWLNGATVGTNNLQAGIYDMAFNAINRGTSTLSASANVCQFDNVTDFYLGPGRYYLALWCNGTTATTFTVAAGASVPEGIYYETNAGGLPTTGTPADPGGSVSAIMPIAGLALRATDP